MMRILLTLAILLSTTVLAQLDDIGADVVPEEAGLVGDLVDNIETKIEGDPFYCIYRPEPQSDVWTEEIVGEGVAGTCGDSCECWLIRSNCTLEYIQDEGLDKCLPVPIPKPLDSAAFSGMTRIVYAYIPMLAWFISQKHFKDIDVMKVSNHYYYLGWRILWMGNLEMFGSQATVFLVDWILDDIFGINLPEMKFKIKYFCKLERFFAFAVQGAALLYFILAPTMSVATKATGKIEMWIMVAIQGVMFFWYIYVQVEHDPKLEAWYFASLSRSKLEESKEKAEEAEEAKDKANAEEAIDDMQGLTIDTGLMGGEALEF